MCFKNIWTSFRIIEGTDKRESDKQGSTVSLLLCMLYMFFKLCWIPYCLLYHSKSVIV